MLRKSSLISYAASGGAATCCKGKGESPGVFLPHYKCAPHSVPAESLGSCTFLCIYIQDLHQLKLPRGCLSAGDGGDFVPCHSSMRVGEEVSFLGHPAWIGRDGLREDACP